MSSTVNTCTVKEQKNEKSLVSAIRNEMAYRYEDEYNGECHCTMDEQIMGYGVVFKKGSRTYEEARALAEKNERDAHFGMYILCCQYQEHKKTKALATLNQRLTDNQKKKEEYIMAHKLAGQKAKLFACQECGSKIARFYYEQRAKDSRVDICPVCNNHMNSKTDRERLARYDEINNELTKKIREEEKKSLCAGDNYYFCIASIHS